MAQRPKKLLDQLRARPVHSASARRYKAKPRRGDAIRLPQCKHDANSTEKTYVYSSSRAAEIVPPMSVPRSLLTVYQPLPTRAAAPSLSFR